MVSAVEASLNGLPNLLARNSVRRLRWRNIGRTRRRYRMAGSPVNPGREFQEADKGHNAESIKGMLPRGRCAVRRQEQRGYRRQLRAGRRLRHQVSARSERCILIWRKAGLLRRLFSTEQQEQQWALLSMKTGIEVSSASFRKRSPVTASRSRRSTALSLRLRPRNRSKIRIASSVDDGSDNAGQEQHDLCRGSNTPPNDGAICAPTKSFDRIGLGSQRIDRDQPWRRCRN
jgi:hypothetical protein